MERTRNKPFRFTLHAVADWMAESFRWHVFYADGRVETFPRGETDEAGTSTLTLHGDVAVFDVLYAPDPYVHQGFLPAMDFFQAGTVNDTDGSVVLPPAGGLYGPNLLLPAKGEYTVACEGMGLNGAVLAVTLGGNVVAEGPANEPLRFHGATSDGPLSLHFRAGSDEPVLRGFQLDAAP